PLAPLMNFAIFFNDLKNYYFNLYSLPVFRCTGTLTDRGKHRTLIISILALSPGCHRIRGRLSPIRPFGDTVVTCFLNVPGKLPNRCASWAHLQRTKRRSSCCHAALYSRRTARQMLADSQATRSSLAAVREQLYSR